MNMVLNKKKTKKLIGKTQVVPYYNEEMEVWIHYKTDVWHFIDNTLLN